MNKISVDDIIWRELSSLNIINPRQSIIYFGYGALRLKFRRTCFARVRERRALFCLFYIPSVAILTFSALEHRRGGHRRWLCGEVGNIDIR